MSMSTPVATEEPDDDFDLSLSDNDNRVGIRTGEVKGEDRSTNGRNGAVGVGVGNNAADGRDGEDDVEEDDFVFQREPLTKDEFSVMSMDYSYGDEEEGRLCTGGFRNLVFSMVCVLIVAAIAVLLPGIRSNNKTLEALRTPARLPVEYDCPKVPVSSSENGVKHPNNDDSETIGNPLSGDDFSGGNDKDNNDSSASVNTTEFLKTFHETNFDDWGKTYDEVKKGMLDFKSTYYPKYLQDGSTIYGNACGNGLNLYMTLEILQETNGIENLFVYGNDALPSNSAKANAVFDHMAPALSRKGKICPSESTHLRYIPENSFDLVYTGYISPLLDPLNFELGTTADFNRYTALCKSDPVEDWAQATLNEIAQRRQNEWYGSWVSEMSRIAKPGVPVIVEQVSSAYCDAFFDWGGVKREWWHDMAANNTFGWDVDPASLVIEDDTIFRDRYHVFMLKNGKRENR